MREPAIAHKEELEKLFAKEIYTDRYFYYCGYPYVFDMPKINAQDNNYQWAILSNDGDVIGYLAYRIDGSTDSVYNFGLYSFDEGNLEVIYEVNQVLEKLVKNHHRVEWRVIEGNHVKRGYDSFCKKHNGNILCLHDVCRDLQGKYRDEYIYEIIRNHV